MTANTLIYTDQGGATQHYSTGAVLDFGGVNMTAGTDRMSKTVRVALAAVDTAGGVLAWANPESVTVFVTRVIFDVTTKATAACTVDVGVAANGTTSNDALMDGLDVGTAAGTFDNIENQGTNGKSTGKVAVGSYVTGSVASGASAGLVGFAYITYHVI